jgi:hypothetical protein
VNDESSLRDSLSSEQRAADARLTIDPGFVHRSRIETLIGAQGMAVIDAQTSRLPPMPDWQFRVRIDHIYTRTALAFCSVNRVKTLSALLASGSGRMFCSTEVLEPCQDVYSEARCVSRINTLGVDNPRVELHYSAVRITSDTTRMELGQGGALAVVATLKHRTAEDVLIFEPLVLGAPWLESDDARLPNDDAMWFGFDFFEHFIEDVDQFAKVRGHPLPTDFSIMQRVSERAFKQCLAEILGDTARKDWGGESSDHFSAHVDIQGRPTTAAFLLKGPAHFAPMGLNHLGKNNDQIFRLSQEPAGLLVVQHCHEILAPVRATLRAFAVQPGAARRYCLIDGRDSLRLLGAYNKVDRALELTRSELTA